MASILGAMANFAVGFVFRPIGGLFFDWLADCTGRKTVLLTTVGGIALGALMIGLTPSFETAGVFTAIMLLVPRLIQGLAYGEMPTAQTYLAEMAPPQHRGLWASMIYVSATAGACIGIFMGVIMNWFLTPEQARHERTHRGRGLPVRGGRGHLRWHRAVLAELDQHAVLGGPVLAVRVPAAGGLHRGRFHPARDQGQKDLRH